MESLPPCSGPRGTLRSRACSDGQGPPGVLRPLLPRGRAAPFGPPALSEALSPGVHGAATLVGRLQRALIQRSPPHPPASGLRPRRRAPARPPARRGPGAEPRGPGLCPDPGSAAHDSDREPLPRLRSRLVRQPGPPSASGAAITFHCSRLLPTSRPTTAPAAAPRFPPRPGSEPPRTQPAPESCSPAPVTARHPLPDVAEFAGPGGSLRPALAAELHPLQVVMNPTATDAARCVRRDRRRRRAAATRRTGRLVVWFSATARPPT